MDLSDIEYLRQLLYSIPESPGVFTGIGSRETPFSICELETTLARHFCAHGWVLRSGGAKGSDSAFEAGAGRLKQIYLPGRGFNQNRSNLYTACSESFARAKEVHGAWHNLSDFAKNAHARNVYQVMGLDFKRISDLLICWTKDGAISEEKTSRATGGTRTAIVLAHRNNVPIINLGNKFHLEMVQDYVRDVILRKDIRKSSEESDFGNREEYSGQLSLDLPGGDSSMKNTGSSLKKYRP